MGWCHGFTQGHLRIFHDMVSPAEWWSSSWTAPRRRWCGGQDVDGLGAGLQDVVPGPCRHIGGLCGGVVEIKGRNPKIKCRVTALEKVRPVDRVQEWWEQRSRTVL